MKIKEVHLANHICHWLLRWGALAFIHDSVGIYDPTIKRFRKNKNPYRIEGVADLLGITGNSDVWLRIHGEPRPLAVEVKLPGNTQSDDQIKFEKRWVDAGGVYVLAYSLLDVKTALHLPDTIEWPKSSGV